MTTTTTTTTTVTTTVVQTVTTLPTIPARFATEADFAAWLNDHPSVWNDAVSESAHYHWGSLDSAAELTLDDLIICFEQAQEPAQIAGLVEYWYNGVAAVCGEYSIGPALDADPLTGRARMFVFGADMTKSRRDDIGDALPYLEQYISEGTPIRKTDRAGEGTKGTRKYAAAPGAFWIAWR